MLHILAAAPNSRALQRLLTLASLDPASHPPGAEAPAPAASVAASTSTPALSENPTERAALAHAVLQALNFNAVDRDGAPPLAVACSRSLTEVA